MSRDGTRTTGGGCGAERHSAAAAAIGRRQALGALAWLAAGCATIKHPVGDVPTPVPRGDLLRSILRRGTLRVATDANYLPQSYRNADGSWTGFDIDVARELARRLGVNARFSDVSFDLITAGRWSGRFDVHVGSMAITAERTADLRFTPAYYYLPASFAVHAKSAIARIGELKGKKVGVGRATTYESYFGETLSLVGEKIAIPPPAADVISYETDAEAIDDLALGDGLRLDAVLSALPTLRSAIAAGRPLKVIDPPVYEEDNAIALDRFSPERNESLATRFDAFVVAMHRDGTLSRLSRHYYGIDLTLRAAGTNLGPRAAERHANAAAPRGPDAGSSAAAPFVVGIELANENALAARARAYG